MARDTSKVSKTCLVIPSNREAYCREFFEAWRGKGGWDFAILVEDNPTCSMRARGVYDSLAGVVDEHHSWETIEEALGDDTWIISRRSDAVRCFGFLRAWQLGYDYVLTLDDDCLPTDKTKSLVAEHFDWMEHRRWTSSYLANIDGNARDAYRVRGQPYENYGTSFSVAHVGLWLGIPDLDARTQLANQGLLSEYSPPRRGSWVVPNGQYVPTCGMNLMISRQALPLFYFPLMGEGQPYHRFGDIWAGVIAKKICDHLRWNVSVGEPFVRHVRASDPHKNLELEAPGVEANEWFWQDIDWIELDSDYTQPTTLMLMRELGESIADNHKWGRYDERPVTYGAWMKQLGRALQVWARLFDKFVPSASSTRTVGATV